MWECFSPAVFNGVTFLVQWLPLIFTIIGTVGNSLTIAALLRMKGPILSTGILLIALAISDTSNLYMSAVLGKIVDVMRRDSHICTTTPAICELRLYLSNVTFTFSSWLLVLISVERVISVRWPHRAATICNRRNTIIAVVVALVTVSIFCLPPRLIEETPELLDYYLIGGICLSFFIPFAILATANGVIIYRLAQLRRTQAPTMACSRRDRNMRRSCILIALVTLQFLLFVGPASVNVILVHLRLFQGCALSYAYLFHGVFAMLTYGNDACNFFSYVLSGGRFRNEVQHLLCCMVNPCKVVLQRRHAVPASRAVFTETEHQSHTQTASVTELTHSPGISTT